MTNPEPDGDDWPEPCRPRGTSYAELRTYLTEVRTRRGMTQVQVAKLMGTKQSNVSDLESGEITEPGIGTFARWAAALDLNLTVQITEKVRYDFAINPATT